MKNINIKDTIYNKLDERVKESNEFNTVDEYSEYILNRVLEKMGGKTEVSKEEKIIKERLKKLGYID